MSIARGIGRRRLASTINAESSARRVAGLLCYAIRKAAGKQRTHRSKRSGAQPTPSA